MEVGGIFHIPNLDQWQGSYGTGPGPMPLPPKKKEPEEEEEKKPSTGVTQDDSGVVHVDLIA